MSAKIIHFPNVPKASREADLRHLEDMAFRLLDKPRGLLRRQVIDLPEAS